MRCPRCGAEGIDPAGYCVNCRLYRGPAAPAPQSPPPPQPTTQIPVVPPPPPPPVAAPPHPVVPPPPPPAMAPPPQWMPPPPGYGPPPPARRNPLLIPGIVFGVVCAVLVAAVIVYAVTSGDDAEPAATNPVVQTTVTPSLPPEPSPTGLAGGLPGPSGSASASGSPRPSTSAAPCLLGVWLEEKHDEQVTVLNTGTFPFTGSGAYHRYSDTGRAVIDYGDGMKLTGSNGSTQFEYIFAGFISYQYKFENGVVTYSAPHPDGTETFIRNGHTDYQGKLEPRVPPPMRVNCGSVAMSLTNGVTTLQLKRTSAAP
ncbi:hypothetical protein [Dactylosporangium sp. CA-092794]|uniref:hypothetical protein n=1 Tax=Dactylosporangium sp. CA-092794 TaxID=3239929 RepID=UPI003D8CA57C